MNVLPLFKGRQDTKPDAVEKLAWLRLARTDNVGPITFYKFIEHFGSAQQAIEALPEYLKKRKRPLKIPSLAAVEKEYEALQKKGGDFIAAFEDTYPLGLSAIEDAPPVIAVIGRTELLSKPAVGMVGARNASINGRKLAEKMARELGQAGQVIVSGLARGIDTAAHAGSLETGTIAVVAGGIDVVYPSENQKLYEEICDKGIVVAENRLGTPPKARDFPRRNRVVSGISQGVVVVEATQRSGSLITARLAGEQGRDVYAVPGFPFDPRAEGPNSLIRDGATLVRHAEDVLENIRSFTGSGFSEPRRAHFDPLDLPQDQDAPDEQSLENARELILQNLSFSPTGLDELLRTCQLNLPVMQLALIELELEGQIQRLPGNRIIRREE